MKNNNNEFIVEWEYFKNRNILSITIETIDKTSGNDFDINFNDLDSEMIETLDILENNTYNWKIENHKELKNIINCYNMLQVISNK